MVMKGLGAEAAKASGNTSGPDLHTPERLLIVDDEPQISRIIEIAAAQLGLTARAINDTNQFETALETTHPTTIFLDITMPGRDGLELIGQLAANAYCGKLVLMSGSDPLFIQMSSKIARARGLRVVGILAKPFRKQMVSDLLMSLQVEAAPERAIRYEINDYVHGNWDRIPQRFDRRRQTRRTVIRDAQIVFNDRRSTLNCHIRDLSLGGACLDFASQQLLPHSFDLLLTGEPVKRCGLRWARRALAGVQFLA